ncbi:adenylate cyclase [Mesorhizobium tianshanense]|uniref:Putative ATPase n=1 Tax=Mesorhizobium tianshanense TaxID=39844 RepID=A0A562MM53_9HYPH|nr:AAA family ATPase [Mesorhizobium tianshanense]TWI20993.1 putative ATPase [Mesorhizobium tianshanense]GLS35228.1 adenylate cyclase [Mesorhizobium tianshanense]
MDLRLTLLGRCILSGRQGKQLRLGTRKSWALFALLAQCGAGGCTREYLAGSLWPTSGEEQARASLRQELAALRKTLKEDGCPDPFETHQGTLTLRHDTIAVDSREFDDIALCGDVERIRSIPQIYRGEFAAGLSIRSAPFAGWLQAERERLCDLAVSALETVLAYDEEHGEPSAVLKTAQAIITMDPAHEAAHRGAMRSLHSLGRSAEALMQFNRLAHILQQKLNAGPSPDTVEVYRQLRQHERATVACNSHKIAAGVYGTPERRIVTVAAFGISARTAASQRLDAEDISELVEPMEAFCRDAIARFGGQIIGCVADRCLAVFGHPSASELDAERAVLAAVDLRSKYLYTATAQEVQICCGIASGEALVRSGEAGSLSVAQMSGPLVTQATTLSYTATEMGVLVCGTTLVLLRRVFKTNAVSIPGHSTGAYQIHGELVAANRFDIGERQKTLSSFIGRESELEHLATLWKRALQGEGQAVTVVGEPGIGKSRLVHHFLRNKVVEVVTRLNFNGSFHHKNTAFYPLIQELRRVLSIGPDDDGEVLTSGLSTWLAELGQRSEHDLNCLRVLLDPNVRSVELEADIAGLIGTIVRCLLRLTEHRPVILIFEDVHWLDPSSRDLLRALQESIGDSRVLLIAVTRPLLEADCPPSVSPLDLGRLSISQTAAVARSIGPSYLSENDTAEIARRSDGIPLFLEELMNSLREAGRGGVAPAIVPTSLQETLMARIDQMGDEKEILHLAAVIGRIFDYALLKASTDYEDAQLQAYLQKLQDRDLVFRIGQIPYARYEFKHALVHELTYRSIVRNTCRSYHRRIADALKSNVAGLGANEPEVTAWHLEKGGVPDQAMDHLEIAGRQAVRVSAHREAARHFRWALRLAGNNNESGKHNERIKQLLLLLGPQLLAERGFASLEVGDVYRRAKALSNICADKSQNCRIVWGLWSNCIVRAQLDLAVELGEEFLGLAEETGDQLNTVAGFYTRGVVSYYLGAFDDAKKAFTTATAVHEDRFDEEMAVRFGINLQITANAYLLWIDTLSGNFERAVLASVALIGQAERCSHDASTGFAHNFISGMYNFMGNHLQAEHHATVAEALSNGQGFAQFRAHARINRGRALDRLGHAKGLELLKQGIADYVETGAELALAYAQAWLAEAFLDQGKMPQAQEAVSVGLSFSARTGVQYFDAELLRIKAVIQDQFGPSPDKEIIDIYEQSLAAATKVGARALSSVAR